MKDKYRFGSKAQRLLLGHASLPQEYLCDPHPSPSVVKNVDDRAISSAALSSDRWICHRNKENVKHEKEKETETRQRGNI